MGVNTLSEDALIINATDSIIKRRQRNLVLEWWNGSMNLKQSPVEIVVGVFHQSVWTSIM